METIGAPLNPSFLTGVEHADCARCDNRKVYGPYSIAATAVGASTCPISGFAGENSTFSDLTVARSL